MHREEPIPSLLELRAFSFPAATLRSLVRLRLPPPLLCARLIAVALRNR
jgi:hypothetical protein